MHLRFILIPLLILSSASLIFAQKDSIITLNQDKLVGEIKEMDRGVLTMETDYSDKDFKIEWKKISEIFTETRFLITLSDGRRYNGQLESTAARILSLKTQEEEVISVNMSQVVFLKEVDQSFSSRLYASIDLDYSITKANDLRQLNTSSKIGYRAPRWSTDGSYSRLRSNQEGSDPLDRSEGSLTFRYFLPNDWYLLPQINFLSNTEQKLKLRTSGKMGIGKFFLHTNSTYWGITAGLNFNLESFSSDDQPRQSLEGYFGSELDLYDIGDLNLFTKAYAYPSFTEGRRWRFDFEFDAKYDLPLDFYIKLSFNINYDNQPAENASETDYVLRTGLGWEW